MDHEIPVYFNGEQKWITGLSRSTTCDDVIYALLRHSQGPNDSIDVSEYRIYEEWKNYERTLSGRTRIIKLWRLLGSKTRQVRLTIRYAPVVDVLDTGSEMSFSSRHRRLRRLTKSGSRNSQSNMTKAEIFQYYNRERSRRSPQMNAPIAPPQSQVDHRPEYVQTVQNQQYELDSLMAQNNALEQEILRYESIPSYADHKEQNTHESMVANDSLFPLLKSKDPESYLHMLDGIINMHDKIEQTHSKACYLASLLHDEQRALRAAQEIPKELREQIEKSTNVIQMQLAECQQISSSQQMELDALSEGLLSIDGALVEKERLLTCLSNELDLIDALEKDYYTTSYLSQQTMQQCDSNTTHRHSPISKNNDCINTAPITNPQTAFIQNALKQQSKVEQPDKGNMNGIKMDASVNKIKQIYDTPLNKPRLNGTHTRQLPDLFLDAKIAMSHHCHASRFLQDNLDTREGSERFLHPIRKTPSPSGKQDSDRVLKGVRFNSDVTEWKYDVLSEDESFPHENGNNQTVFNVSTKYSPVAMAAIINKQNALNNAAQYTSIPATILPPVTRDFERSPFSSPSPTRNTQFILPPYTTQVRCGTYINSHDDSNSDTGLSSMNSEEDILPLETLV